MLALLSTTHLCFISVLNLNSYVFCFDALIHELDVLHADLITRIIMNHSRTYVEGCVRVKRVYAPLHRSKAVLLLFILMVIVRPISVTDFDFFFASYRIYWPSSGCWIPSRAVL